MEQLSKVTNLSKQTQDLLKLSVYEARCCKVSEVDTGHLALATLSDQKLRQKYGLSLNLSLLRKQLVDFAGYIPEQLARGKVNFNFSPGVSLLMRHAQFLADVKNNNIITPDNIYESLHNENIGGFGNVLFRRAGIYLTYSDAPLSL